MRKLVVLVALMALSFGTFAQEVFVRNYQYRTSEVVNADTKKYDIDFQKQLPTTVVFNINSTRNAKIMLGNNSEITLYNVIKDDVQESDDYITFTAYVESGDKVVGALGSGFFMWGFSKYLWTYQTTKPE